MLDTSRFEDADKYAAYLKTAAASSPFLLVFEQGDGTMTQVDTQPASQSALVRPAATGGFALGLGLTNECNLACSFCYRDPARTDRLSLEQVRSVMESLQLNAPLRRTQHHPAHQGKGPREGKKLL